MEEDDDECGGGFMELLGCDDAAFDKRLTQLQQEFLFSPPLSTSVAGFSPQMLHFGGGGAAGGPHDEELLATAAAAAANEGSRGAKVCMHACMFNLFNFLIFFFLNLIEFGLINGEEVGD